jgi:general secretion pathway protein G
MKVRTNDEGYTLTEMLVVIGIIGLIAAALTPAMIGQMGRARAKAARLQVETVGAAVEMFRTDVGRYPTPEEGLNALVRAPGGTEGWTGPYVRDAKSIRDPWGRALAYRADDQDAFTVASLGSDGKPGGEGTKADLIFPEPVK